MDILSNIPVQVLYGFMLFQFVLCLVALFWVWRLAAHYNSLTRGVDKPGLQRVLETLNKNVNLEKRKLIELEKDLAAVKDEGKTHLQNLTVMRYNPFTDTGGDQSFILGLTDGHGTGAVITSLHSRENTRLYVKAVKSGKGVSHPLSKEEEKVLVS